MLAAATGPSWYWYATRGLGAAGLVLLTATVVLGIGTARRWSGPRTPGFVVAALHRNLSLLAVAVVGLHVVTTILDPFARITVRDAVVPFGAAYRPVWLGLGVAASEVVLAVVLTSLLRDRLGPRLWRLLHWAAYSSWPVAMLHSLGTGSDAQAPWLIGLCGACLTAVLMALGERLLTGRPATLLVRLAAGAGALAALYAGAAWAFSGPFEPGWAARSGTPAAALAAPLPARPGGFSDPLSGTLVKSSTGYTQIAFRDTYDTRLTVTIRSAASTETLPVLQVARGSRVLCSVPAAPGAGLYAVCGRARLAITIFGPADLPVGTSAVSGRIDVAGALG